MTVHSCPDGRGGAAAVPDEEVWTLHATGTLVAADDDGPSRPAAEVWPPRGAVPVGVDDLYDRLADMGYEYGPLFQGVRAAWRRGEDVFAEVALPDVPSADTKGFGIHPALLDAVFHMSIDPSSDEVRLPFVWSGVELSGPPGAVLRVTLSPSGEAGVAVAVA
ncbi:polyketide synthase dehydratase domain-containing protein, partial [Streptomyces sp. NRRL S-118]|uniref:polyketide synthase dehydratase domain-containing protein n=1 Tax=Streptomyces sp. NRRL S-118 TaxID=1463881 RepID=UPI002D218F8B